MTFKRNNLSQDVIHALTLTLVLCLTLLSGCSDKEEILPPEPEEGTDIVSEYKAYVGHPFNASLGEQTKWLHNKEQRSRKTENGIFRNRTFRCRMYLSTLRRRIIYTCAGQE